MGPSGFVAVALQQLCNFPSLTLSRAAPCRFVCFCRLLCLSPKHTHLLFPPQASQVLTRVSGQLQSAAALLVELARAASASSVELSGSNPLLTANTAAVLQQQDATTAAGQLVPAFPTLYPQLPPGVSGDRAAAGGELVSLCVLVVCVLRVMNTSVVHGMLCACVGDRLLNAQHIWLASREHLPAAAAAAVRLPC